MNVARLRRVLLPSYVDELLYLVRRGTALPTVEPGVSVRVVMEAPGRTRRTRYIGIVNDQVAHVSVLFSRVFLLRTFGFRGDLPCIGESVTKSAFRGQRIYPYVLQHIIRDVFARLPHDRIYILVAPSNKASIRGIEAAGFSFEALLRGWRLGPFLLKRKRA